MAVEVTIDLRENIELIRSIQNVSGLIEKHNIITSNKNNGDFKRLLYYACNPMLTYKVTMPTLMQSARYDSAITLVHTHIYEVCDTLSSRRAIDDALLYQVLAFLEMQPEYERHFYKELLSKTLRLGVTAKSINKAIPGLIPEWDVQQAYPIEKHPLKDGAWFAVSEKLNGVRATFYRGELMSRSGIAFTGFDRIVTHLSVFPNMVFDGELTLIDTDGLSDNEAFRKATGIINSDSEDKTEICFTIFDALPLDEFDAGCSKDSFRIRRQLLDSPMDSGYVTVLPLLYSGTDQSVIEPLLEKMSANDKEGLMVNLDVSYKCKRHSGILKVKRFYTMDLPIIRCEEGGGRLSGTLGAIVVDFNGNEVSVGSGFTDEQRSQYWNDKERLRGVLAEVKYKEISTDKSTGSRSLQFPVFVSLRIDKEEISYG
jgi:DNA ligase-1